VGPQTDYSASHSFERASVLEGFGLVQSVRKVEGGSMSTYSLCDLTHVLGVTAAVLAILITRSDFPRPTLELPGDKHTNICGSEVGYRLYEAEAVDEWRDAMRKQGCDLNRLATMGVIKMNDDWSDEDGFNPEDLEDLGREHDLSELDEDFDNDEAAEWLRSHGH
jgi:hypothetical protein